MDELQAASAVGQGDLFRAYESRLAERRARRAAQVLLTAADIAARTNYLNARQTLRRLLEWGVVPVINENDTTATDEISFGDNDFLAAQVALLLDARLLVLLTNVDGLLQRRPARSTPDAELIARGRRLRRADGAGDRRPHLGLRLRRDAQQGRGGGDGQRGRDPGGDLQRHRAGDAAAAAAGERRSAPASPPRQGKALELQALAQVREAGAGADRRRRRRRPGPARERLQPAAGRDRRGRGRASRPATRSTSLGDGEPIGKGIADYSSRELAAVIGMKSAEVRELLPHAADEVIHRDRFVLV